MILVTGDVVLDHNIYAGQRFTPDSDAVSGMQYRKQPGGAMLTYCLLDAVARAAASSAKGEDAPSAIHLAFGLQQSTADALQNWPSGFQAGAVWEPFDGPKKGQLHWRLSKNLGYGARGHSGYPASLVPGLDELKPKVLVIDDGGLGFRLKTASQCWPPLLTSESEAPQLEWIILKMSRPLARGDLWRELAARWRERLIVLVSGDNLRREDVRVSRGLSWESTVDDLVNEVQSNPAVHGLQSCRHLVITLRGDAALWLDEPGRKEQGPCRLVFDRERGEGEWEDGQKDGNAFGFLSAVTTAIAWHLAGTPPAPSPDLVPALKAGLSTTRFLREYGHGPVKGSEPGFPFQGAASHLLNPAHKYAAADVRCSGTGCPAAGGASGAAYWTILGQSSHSDAFPGPMFGSARRLALLGPAALENVPCARFGKLLTLDRREIEALRSLRQLMLSYRDGGPQKQPLSLAVFGAPGSGKSFGLKQIAEGVFGDKNPVLEFNLSQFKGPDDLIGAYHQVRDAILAGKTPVVFWDEFDSRNCVWLQYLLAPMQDGAFQEGQLSHAIGKCVFVFAGGTSRDFAHFGPPDKSPQEENEAQRKARHDFIMAKGPDFKSRLAGFLDVLGPNPGQVYDDQSARNGLEPWVDDQTDLDFPVRRAVLLRSLLGLVKEKENEPLAIDRGLLTALLETSHYRHGARSMEKLVSQMKDRGGLPLRRAHLPPDSLLALYVDDVPGFHALIRRSYSFLTQAETLAPALHQDWLDNLTVAEKTGPYYKTYEELDQEGKAANIASASRIPEILALAGFVLEQGAASDEEDANVGTFLKQNQEFLAEAEHQGWEEQKRMEGWTYGPPPRDNAKRTHPLLVPYSELPEEEKDKDRRTIKNYPKYARAAGFKIMSRRTGNSGV
ncbi:MAG: RyR domain-containing protein [Bryobacteraceae bacterium]